jgi:eukaryotic-like serine/threonine-protein kinase
VTPARWSQIKELFSAALETPETERSRFLESACGGDADLRAEVERLLAGNAEPSWQSPAVKFLTVAAELAPGDTVAHYRIEARLGEGGMGVVYKAKDTHLGRSVALKFVKVQFSRHWEREARAVAALNHPHIATLYEVGDHEGSPYLAMEWVDGRALKGPLPVTKAIEYGIQMADALAVAHAAGIVHRDLKPANILVTEKGSVKVLDFGLAKLTEIATSEFGATAALRSTEGPSAEEGTIVGTTAYMSPEQAEGKKVDARSDIFSFGAVLYEMVTGRQAFYGDSKLSTLSAILREEPKPVSSIMPEVPRDVEKIISRCLRKDPERRFQHMDDLKVALQEVKEEWDSGKLSGVVDGSLPRGRRKRWLIWVGGLIVLSVIAAAGAWLRFVGPAANPGLSPRTVPLTSYPGDECCPSFSPDGNQVAFVWDGPKQDNDDIYVKLIGTENALRLTSDPAVDENPAWSPDGRYIAFLRILSANRVGLFLVSAIGGPERKLTEISSGWGGVAWHPEGKWLAFPDQNSICLLSVDTGEKRKLTFPPSGRSDETPAFSPDGRRLAFSRNFTQGVSEMYLLALSQNLAPKGEPKQLTFRHQSSRWPAWFASGREIVFSTGAALGTPELWRMPASGGGSAQPLVAAAFGDHPAISRQGNRLAYTRVMLDANIWRLEVPGSNSKASEPVSLIASHTEDSPQYSPDGKRVVFCSSRSGAREIWVSESDGSNAMQLTSLGATMSGSPRWSPDGQRIVFDSNIEGQFELYQMDASGGTPRRLTNHPADDAVASYSRDGRWVYFGSNRTGRWEIWKLPATGGQAVQVTRNGGRVAFESLDGAFVYYAKDVENSSLWRIPVGGGDEVEILKSVAGIAFALANQGIYFEQPNSNGSTSIQFLSFATGKAAVLATITRPWDAGLSVSPNERYILYTQVDRTSSNLMLVENFR